MPSQIAKAFLMIRPARFGYNPETADSNAFQQNNPKLTLKEIRTQAKAEFDSFADKLRAHDIRVLILQDSASPTKTDAVFPNNWVSFHQDGLIITYPMYASSRRVERSEAVLQRVLTEFQEKRRIDFSLYEASNRFLEGTGSLVLDRVNRLAYACLSPRTNKTLVEKFCQFAHFNKVIFHATDVNGKPIYHTNVMLTIGEHFVVVCLEAVTNSTERQQLIEHFEQSEKELIEISLAQMEHFAGNLLQVKNRTDESYLVMSEQAFQALEPSQIERLKKHTKLLHSPLYTIEKFGGGSARCMLAEIFLPELEADS